MGSSQCFPPPRGGGCAEVDDEAMVQPILFLLLTMTIVSTTTVYALVPSQVRGVPQYHRSKQKKTTTTNEGNDINTRSSLLFRATVGGGDGTAAVRTAAGVIESSSSAIASVAGDDVVYSSVISSTATLPSSNKKKSNKKKKKNTTATNTHRSTQQPSQRTGNIPDVYWRSISMNHLRAHPNYIPLPPPTYITHLPSREHVRYFRQDSWQWDYLHIGRCTTSQASSALGFLEPKCATYLGIPKSLQRGGFGAFDRLRQRSTDADQSLLGWERTLCSTGQRRRSKSTTTTATVGTTRIDGDEDDDNDVWSWKPGTKETERLWKPMSHLLHNKSYPFVAMYRPTVTYADLYRRKLHLLGGSGGGAVVTAAPIRTRMEWGNVQEATSILTALNYFCTIDNTTTIREVGMCGASFDDYNDDDDDETIHLLQGVKIGASPDAIICHGNGTIEVLEVKNHCPFVWNRASSSSNNMNRYNKHQRMEIERQREAKNTSSGRTAEPQHRFSIRDFELEQKIPPAYLPQLMMEMLCVGTSVTLNDKEGSMPICKSAIMVRQTATKGAIILRLHRDNEWINEMKYWLGMFQSNFVSTNTIPHDNFFWNDDPDSRYLKFVTRTKEISESVELVAYIDHSQIQRMLLRKGEEGRGGVEVGGEIPLFLDNIITDVS